MGAWRPHPFATMATTTGAVGRKECHRRLWSGGGGFDSRTVHLSLERAEDEAKNGHQSPILESNFPTMSLASKASRLATLAVERAVLRAP